MIYRLSLKSGFTRINELSDALNVHPPSATRMVQRLGKQDLLKYEKYGVIVLKDEGKILGEFLLKRHNIIETFLKKLGRSTAGRNWKNRAHNKRKYYKMFWKFYWLYGC